MTNSQAEHQRTELGWPDPLLDLLEAVASSWRLVLGIVLFGVLATGTALWCMPPFYVSSAVAVLMPREKPTLDIAVNTPLLRTSENAARQAPSAPLMLPPQPELYVELLRSDRVINGIAELRRSRLDPDGRLDAVDLTAMVRDMVKVVGSEEGLLTVSVTSEDHEMAAELANAFLEAGENASKSIERNLVLDQLSHLEPAIAQARADLEVDEAELRQFYTTHGLLNPEQEATENLRQIRETNMLRDKLQRELGERRVQFADQEVGVVQLRRQIAIADERLANLQQRAATGFSGAKYGELLVAHDRLQERIRRRRDLLQTLDAQLMVYRVRADQPSGSMVAIKRASASTMPAGPRKKRIVLAGAVGSVGCAVLLAILLRQWRRAQADSYFRDRVRSVRRHLPLAGRARRTTA